MSQSAVSQQQMMAIFQNLPASCVIDAMKGVYVRNAIGHWFLLECEKQGLVEWKRDKPQQISLSKKGQEWLDSHMEAQ